MISSFLDFEIYFNFEFGLLYGMNKSMKKVWINPGCITCGRCEFIAPEVFEVSDIARVNQGVDIEKHVNAIQEAAKTCPVQVIKYALEDKNSST